MNNHPRADAPGNVPLWRCILAGKCHAVGCCHRQAAPKHDFPCFVHYCGVGRTYVTCEVVGFRVPPRCEDCENYDNEGFSETACKLGTHCRGKDNYTPRTARKETTAEDDLIRVICDETKLARGMKP